MAFTCKQGLILYGRRCIGCDCERASLPLPEQPLRGDFKPATIRVMKILGPPSPANVPPPERPSTAPTTCLYCGATTLPCYKCQELPRFPLQGQFSTHYHTGHCPEHGLLRQLCPESSPPDDPIMRGIEDRAAHFNKATNTAAGVGLAIGFIIGTASGLAVAAFYFSQLSGG